MPKSELYVDVRTNPFIPVNVGHLLTVYGISTHRYDLVYLKKEANLDNDLFADMFDDLAQDGETGAGLAGQFRQAFEVALPNSLIENRVSTFNAAIRSMQAAVFAEAKAMHYAKLLGKTMAEHMDQKGAKAEQVETITYVKTTIAERYGKLKDAAWAGILRSSNVTSKLSSKAQRRVESEFERIKKLEFTCQTIYGFLLGIVESQGQIQIDMACDVFDSISQYHTDGNTVWYKGWKSNDKHRTCGRKIKLSRFVIPRNRTWCDSMDWDSMQMLRDFDKVFAMLDGRAAPEISLESLFTNHLRALKRGERLSGSYFDVRFYPGAGTIHFFPNKKKNLVDRLNRLVGKHRQWLPPSDKGVSENFWLAYEKAESLDAQVHKETAKSRGGFFNTPFHSMFCRDGDERAAAEAKIVDAIEKVLEANGISPHFQAIEHVNPQQPLLLAA